MIDYEERKCPHCNKIFYVQGLKYCDAKTLSCFYCKKRFKVNVLDYLQEQGAFDEEYSQG